MNGYIRVKIVLRKSIGVQASEYEFDMPYSKDYGKLMIEAAMGLFNQEHKSAVIGQENFGIIDCEFHEIEHFDPLLAQKFMEGLDYYKNL